MDVANHERLMPAITIVGKTQETKVMAASSSSVRHFFTAYGIGDTALKPVREFVKEAIQQRDGIERRQCDTAHGLSILFQPSKDHEDSAGDSDKGSAATLC